MKCVDCCLAPTPKTVIIDDNSAACSKTHPSRSQKVQRCVVPINIKVGERYCWPIRGEGVADISSYQFDAVLAWLKTKVRVP